MKKILLIILSIVALTAAAQTPVQMLDKAVAAMKKGVVTANYSVKSSKGNMSGSITMCGNKFRLISSDLKCWYDGKTQWTYSKATDEVDITTPTAADLQMTNPMAAAQGFKKNFNMWKAATQIEGHYTIMLMPKTKSDIKKLYLYISNGTNLLHKAHFQMKDGTSMTLTLSNCKTGGKQSAGLFTFNKSQVPAGTQVVDLR